MKNTGKKDFWAMVKSLQYLGVLTAAKASLSNAIPLPFRQLDETAGLSVEG